jgi:CRISPR system Cascade subunit CasD
MGDLLVLRLEAPLMSFGGVAVDNRGANVRFPGASWVAGLAANALGYDHRNAEGLQTLQAGLRIGARLDRPGTSLTDYQTVDLGQQALCETGWTTRGQREDRRGGTASTGTHIRMRPYWADAVVTVCLGLDEARSGVTLDRLEGALLKPERPVFLGRKPCVPSARVMWGRVEATGIREGLTAVARHRRAEPGSLWASWPEDEGPGSPADRLVWTSDMRDFRNQVHTGRRNVWEGLVDPPRGEAT